MKLRLPKIPFIGEKILLKRRSLEGEGKDKGKYEIHFNGEFPEKIVKTIYNFTLKKHTRVNFESGLREGKSIEVPTQFFKQKAGLDTWQEAILKQLNAHFIEVHNKLGWIFITKSLNLMRITKKNNKFEVYMKVTGEKSDKK